MSIWTRISEALAALAKGETLAAVFEKLTTPPERSVAFTIAVIALGAKMAKADGTVTRNEVIAFRQVFRIPKEDEAQAARVFNLARQDVAGFEIYARRIARMFRDAPEVLEDILEGLFHISMADGHYHPAEDEFLQQVAQEFGISQSAFARIRARHVPNAYADPYAVLGVEPGTPIEEIRAEWRRQVRETHPDVMMARGVPEEAIKLATDRLAILNRAWEEISASENA
ncbi:MAG: TerB family tellurite resistance protein [Paracoccaceae bacterium]